MSTVTIFSKRDENGIAALEECTLVTGFGPVSFRGGQAEVTPEQATILASANPNIQLTRNGEGQLTAETIAAMRGPALPVALLDASPNELDWCGNALAALRGGSWDFATWVQATMDFNWPKDPAADERMADALPPDAIAPTGTGAPATPPVETAPGAEDDGGELEPAPGGDDPETPRAEDLQVDPSLAAAQDYLRAEGEHVPKTLPSGFEALTGEGEPRCYARKGDGSQCTNIAKVEGTGDDRHSTYVCGLPTHVAQVGKLP